MSQCSIKPNSKLRKHINCFMAATVLLACTSVMAPAFADDSMTSNLSKLEDKYFQHDFSKDETTDRLERLEKLVFGEARTGGNEQRLKTLLDMVPDLNAPKADDAASKPSSPAPTQPAPKRTYKAEEPVPDKTVDREPSPNDSSYPAVTAIEKKLLGRDYIGESVGKRLDRLEIKAFGKTAASDELQDRVDRLKSATGIDIAKAKPANSEWADEEEDPDLAGSQGVQPFTGIAGDDPSQQRNYRKQAQGGYQRPKPYDPYAGTGTFGAGSSGTSSSGGYGSGSFGGGNTAAADPGMPQAAPDFSRGASGAAPPVAPQLGVSQKLALLEREVFKKTYDKETILNRLNRLETTVFPQDKPASDRSLPERMGRLLAAVPISPNAATAAADPPPAPKRKRDPDFPDLDFGPSNLSSANQAPRGQGGLSKIINGLGGALSGGYSGTYSGNYAATPGTLITDPQTGLLYDQYTGTYIDPMTGAVVSRRATSGYGGMGNMGTMNGYGYPAYGGFNSGFSPSPFGRMGVGGMGGMGSGMGFGFGSGSGMRIGF